MSEPIDYGKNIARIRTRIANACSNAGRDPQSVRLIAVTKTISIDPINEAIAQGVTDIGENRVQEAESKFALINGAIRHLIGHLQTNKVRRAVELFDYIHSIDSLRLAERVDRIAAELGRRPIVFAQVDISHEETKSGVDEKELAALAEGLWGLSNIEFRGLMGIPPLDAGGEAARAYFRHLRELRDGLEHRFNKQLPELSMGMSGDFEVAIAEGATMVRVGTAIFGAR